MDTTSLIFALLGAAAGAAGSWLAAKAHFGREAEGLRAQLDKAEKARQQATQMWQQARREVEQLQKDALSRGVPSRPAAAPGRDAETERLERAAAAEAAFQSAAGDNPPSVLPAHGFADTQPMTSPGRL